MDIEAFLIRTGLSKADLLRKLGLDPKSSLISAYIKERSKPSYEICEKLIKLGISAYELFDKEIADELIRNSSDKSLVIPKQFESPEFMEGVARALEQLKAMGKA